VRVLVYIPLGLATFDCIAAVVYAIERMPEPAMERAVLALFMVAVYKVGAWAHGMR